jgi:hypothetical protein
MGLGFLGVGRGRACGGMKTIGDRMGPWVPKGVTVRDRVMETRDARLTDFYVEFTGVTAGAADDAGM